MDKWIKKFDIFIMESHSVINKNEVHSLASYMDGTRINEISQSRKANATRFLSHLKTKS